MEQKFSIKKDLKILFIGETGSGKSTLINLAVNIIHGNNYNSERKIAIPQKQKFVLSVGGEDIEQRFKVDCNIEEFKHMNSETGTSENQSQTTSPNMYCLQDKNTGKKITIIDTPGLNDTRGTQFDDRHIKSIIHAIFYISGIDLICIVQNATEPRLKQSTQLAMTRLIQMFTRDCLKNFVICLTNSPKTIAPNCMGSLKELGIPSNNIFRFENSCLVHPDNLTALSKKFSEDEQMVEEVLSVVCVNQMFWNDNKNSFKKLIEVGNNMKCIDTEGVKNLFLEMEAIEKMFQYVTDTIRQIEKNYGSHLRERDQIAILKDKMSSNRDFEETVILTEKIVKKVMDTRKEKRAISYEVAKMKRRSETWGWGTKFLYGVAAVATLGVSIIVDAADSLLGMVCGSEIDGYFEWVDVPYEREEIEWKEVRKQVVDSEKEELFKQAEDSLKVAEVRFKMLNSTIERQREDIEKAYQLVAYLLEKMKQSAIGGPISIDTIINQIDNEIQNIKFDKRPESSGKTGLDTIRELQNQKERLKLTGEIIEKAKKMKVTRLTDDLEILLEKFMSREQVNEGAHLSFNRQSYENITPCFINKK